LTTLGFVGNGRFGSGDEEETATLFDPLGGIADCSQSVLPGGEYVHNQKKGSVAKL
jgi:hypothetical protein